MSSLEPAKDNRMKRSPCSVSKSSPGATAMPVLASNVRRVCHRVVGQVAHLWLNTSKTASFLTED